MTLDDDSRWELLKEYPHILALIKEAESACRQFGVPGGELPRYEVWIKPVEERDSRKDQPAKHVWSGSCIKIDIEWKGWRDPSGRMLKAGPDGLHRLSTSRADHLIIHEIGHHVHRSQGNKAKAVLSTVQKEVAGKVSGYAGKSTIGEFLAEVFVALVDGRVLSEEVLALYRELGGWEPSRIGKGD